GYGALRRRLKKQAGLWARETHQGTGLFALEKVLPVDVLLAWGLRILGLERAGLRNFMTIETIERRVAVPGLPESFRGFRILQLSDLHCDLHPPLAGLVAEIVRPLVYDLAVFTGDYHNKVAGPPETSLALMRKILDSIRPPRLGVLGNHDFIEKVAYLEEAGLRVLLNESACIERGKDRLWFCGIDDPHFFRADDLVRALADIPPEACKILLSHSPEPYLEAERLGFSLMLCGHTHGGQFCLPGGVPILRNTRAPRRLLAGAWSQGRMQGYTSRGTGGCGVAARFFSTGEITLHILEPA
ncbi:MAG: metallophosphoesterase, partial [Terrimicrobiaceae bacterium]|nr:metallophosphoesterase [Terrimicrobiaceae bacterium]